jgi:2-oxo-4-hydroxy-4-carboxy--5-ureidoimidazoline (OHCU) decarboxylase
MGLGWQARQAYAGSASFNEWESLKPAMSDAKRSASYEARHVICM